MSKTTSLVEDATVSRIIEMALADRTHLMQFKLSSRSMKRVLLPH